MSLLALNMISDYKRDIQEDRDLGKYNPVDNGTMSHDVIRTELLKTIESVDCPQMDEIMDSDEAPMGWWE